MGTSNNGSVMSAQGVAGSEAEENWKYAAPWLPMRYVAKANSRQLLIWSGVAVLHSFTMHGMAWPERFVSITICTACFHLSGTGYGITGSLAFRSHPSAMPPSM